MKKKANQKQSKLIQVRVNENFKDKVELAAKMRGLPTSTFFKTVMSDYLRKEEALTDLDLSFSKKEITEELINDLVHTKPSKKFSFKQALDLINQTEN